MFWQAVGAARDLSRAQDIAGVLIRYGFGDMVRRLGMADALSKAGKVLHWQVPDELARLEPPARARRALEDLGPTFVKLGQILATRVDLFAPEWIDELSKLQDAAPAVPFEAVRAQLTEDLGETPEAAFATLNTQPLAAASLAQVYRATLHDGREVVLKVRRPGIRPTVEADLRLLTRLAETIDADMPELHRYHPQAVVREFAVSLRRELDFAAEGRSAERIRAHFAGHDDIVIPAIHWQWSGERLNVQDYIAGIPGRNLAAVDAIGLDRRQLARRGADAVLKMTLEDGFFHADPHPGNVFYLPGNRIAFIDFGMVGRLSESRRYEVASLMHGLVSGDSETVANILLDWRDGEDLGADTDPARLHNEIDTFVDQYKGVPLKRLSLSGMLADLVAILRDNRLTLPADLALLIKAFISLEGMGRQLDPDFDMAGEAAPYLERTMIAHQSPAALARRGWRAARGAADLIAGLPQDLSQLLRAAKRGKLRVEVEVLPLKHFGDRIDRAVSRLTIGIVTAALIIGTSIVMSMAGEGLMAGLSTYALIGFLGAVIGGVWLLLSIRRSNKD